MLTTVAAFRESWEAHMFCSRLEAEGVPALVVHEYHIGNAWHYSTALGGVKVQVCEDRKEEARSIERRCLSGEFRELLETQFGTMDDIHCPHCGSHEYWKRRPFLRAAMAITLSALFGIILPPLGWVYFCNQCGTKFRQPWCPLTFDKLTITLTAIACDFVLFLALALCVWTLRSKYWPLVAVVAIILVGRLTTGQLSKLDNDQD
jgi:DNA-directed RNA polymerase subunit RPC12/RpoP